MTRYRKGGRQMISLRFDPDLLKALDKLAAKLNKNRSELLEAGAVAILKDNGVKDWPRTTAEK